MKHTARIGENILEEYQIRISRLAVYDLGERVQDLSGIRRAKSQPQKSLVNFLSLD